MSSTTRNKAASATQAQPSALLRQFLAARPSVKERMAAGKSLREKVPRRAHAAYSPSPTRNDPISILEDQAKTRLPQFVPIRYARMLASPFAFLRGAAAVMASDLAGTSTTGVNVQACGDMHVSNFGFFGSAERNLVFGINDFDETLPGPWEWDLKRLAASAPPGPSSAPIANGCASMPRWDTWKSGMPGSTSRRCSARFPRKCANAPSK